MILNWRLAAIQKIALGDPDDVVPQRSPLVFFVPDIGALERGNLKMTATLKEISRTSRMSIHCMHLPTTTFSVTRYRSTKHESDKSCAEVFRVAGKLKYSPESAETALSPADNREGLGGRQTSHSTQ